VKRAYGKRKTREHQQGGGRNDFVPDAVRECAVKKPGLDTGSSRWKRKRLGLKKGDGGEIRLRGTTLRFRQKRR